MTGPSSAPRAIRLAGDRLPDALIDAVDLTFDLRGGRGDLVADAAVRRTGFFG